MLNVTKFLRQLLKMYSIAKKAFLGFFRSICTLDRLTYATHGLTCVTQECWYVGKNSTLFNNLLSTLANRLHIAASRFTSNLIELCRMFWYRFKLVIGIQLNITHLNTLNLYQGKYFGIFNRDRINQIEPRVISNNPVHSSLTQEFAWSLNQTNFYWTKFGALMSLIHWTQMKSL